MKDGFEAHMLEDSLSHWWFLSRQNAILALLKRNRVHESARILDLGCGSGHVVGFLKRYGYSGIIGVDLSSVAVATAKRMGVDDIQVMDATALEFEAQYFDVLIASDILEHIGDDVAALREWRRVLKPSGYMIVFVPAHEALWSFHDLLNEHYRRYSMRKLDYCFQLACIKVCYRSYWNSASVLPAVMLKLLRRSGWRSNAEMNFGNLCYSSAWISQFMLFGGRIDNYCLRRGFRLPFGLSICFVGSHLFEGE